MWVCPKMVDCSEYVANFEGVMMIVNGMLEYHGLNTPICTIFAPSKREVFSFVGQNVFGRDTSSESETESYTLIIIIMIPLFVVLCWRSSYPIFLHQKLDHVISVAMFVE